MYRVIALGLLARRQQSQHWSMRWLNLVGNLYTAFNIGVSSPFKDTYAQSMNARKEGPSDQSGMLDKRGCQ